MARSGDYRVYGREPSERGAAVQSIFKRCDRQQTTSLEDSVRDGITVRLGAYLSPSYCTCTAHVLHMYHKSSLGSEPVVGRHRCGAGCVGVLGEAADRRRFRTPDERRQRGHARARRKRKHPLSPDRGFVACISSPPRFAGRSTRAGDSSAPSCIPSYTPEATKPRTSS